jgi:hypothetical protein
MTLWKEISWMLPTSFPTKDGCKIISGHLKRNEPAVMMLLPGRSYAFALSGFSDAAVVSVPESSAM